MKECLFKMQDPEYRDFHSRLMPNIPKERIIGVRTPALRSFAKSIAATDEAKGFLKELPHYYYEENNLHGAIIIYGKYGFAETLKLLECFLPYIDNWATCDMFVPPVLKQEARITLKYIRKWLGSDHPYTVRFALNCLMHFYMEHHFSPLHFTWVDAIKNQDYYVKMGIAWYYSIALVKQWDEAYEHLAGKNLDPWIQNKSIQKARESFRLSGEQKESLLALKIK